TIGSSVSAGIYTSTITVDDGTNTELQTLSWTIYPSSAASITNPGDHSSAEGATVSLSLSSSYSGSGTVTYAALGLPAGLAFNSSTGAITGTVAAGDAALGPYSVTIQVAASTYSAEQSFTWTIDSPITITTPADQTNTESDTVSLSI